jgi:GTPase SAR1 family protein
MPFIKAEDRLARKRSLKLGLVGVPGIGKTSLLWTLPPEQTLHVEIEDGDLSVATWPGDVYRPHPALFTAINADTMEIYAELVPFDVALAQRMSDRAVKVISATEAGELLPRSYAEQTHFECRMCAWSDRCWRTHP